MSLAQLVASAEPSILNLFIPLILTKLLTLILNNQHRNVPFNFNPENIQVLSIDNLVLQPMLVIRVDPATLQCNQPLKQRWNIVLDADSINGNTNKTLDYQNRLGLAVLSFWLENDGKLPSSIIEKHVKILHDLTYRKEWLASIDCHYEKLIIETIDEPLDRVIQKVKDNPLPATFKPSTTGIVKEVVKNRSQLLL